MTGLSTQEIVDLALKASGDSELPADSAIFVDGAGLNKVFFGIDIGSAELMLARELGCDGVIAHHPPGGAAMLGFPKVLKRHLDLMVKHGVPDTAARRAVEQLVTRAVLTSQASNHDHVPSIARLLEMPFLNLHLPLDEIGRRIMVNAIETHLKQVRGLPTVQDAIDALCTLPEFASAPTRIMVPVGAVDSPLGRVAVAHGAGTNGGFPVAKCYFDHGIRTVIYIHIAPDQVNRLRMEASGNLIVTGHIAADLIGINVFVKKLEKAGVEVVRAAGL
jgi:hypothetical protein